MSTNSRIKHMIRNPSAQMRYLTTGQLPKGITPKSPLIDLLKAINPSDRGEIRGLAVNASLGYAGSRQFHSGHQALMWVAPSDEVFGSFPAESFRHKGFNDRLYLEDLAKNSSGFPEYLFRHYPRLCNPKLRPAPNPNSAPAATEDDEIAAEVIRLKISEIAESVDLVDAGTKIVAQLNQIPSTISAVNFVRGGFQLGSEPSQPHKSLAEKMIISGNVDALEYVVTHNKLGINLEDVCTWNFFGYGRTVSVRTLAEFAVEQSSPTALRLAIKLADSQANGGRLNGPSLPALHFASLRRSVLRHITLDAAEKYLECAEILAAHSVPAISDSYSSNPIGSALLDAKWRPEMTSRLALLLRHHHAAGQFNVDALLDKGLVAVAEMIPLEAAMKMGNALAAKEIINLGCQTTGAGLDTLIDHVRDLDLANEDEMIACVTEGVMGREIGSRTATGTSEPAAAARRPRRAGL